MTNEPPGVTLDDDAMHALLDRPLTELTVDELMALKAAYAARGYRIVNSVPWEVVALVAGAALYSKTFMETLARHNAEWLISAVRDRIRKNGEATELVVGPENNEAATLVFTVGTPDEARLALLDLDVTAEDVRGKTLRWDDQVKEWIPDSPEE